VKKTDQNTTSKQLLVQLKAQAAGILSEGKVLSSFKHKGLQESSAKNHYDDFSVLIYPADFMWDRAQLQVPRRSWENNTIS
jgi:hypothetical protein